MTFRTRDTLEASNGPAEIPRSSHAELRAWKATVMAFILSPPPKPGTMLAAVAVSAIATGPAEVGQAATGRTRRRPSPACSAAPTGSKIAPQRGDLIPAARARSGPPSRLRGRREAGGHRATVAALPRAGGDRHRQAEARQGMTGASGRGEGFVVIDAITAGRVLPRCTEVPGCTGARPAGERRGHGCAHASPPSPGRPVRPFPGTAA